MKLLIFFLFVFSFTAHSTLVLDNQFDLNGSRNGQMEQGKKALWEFSFFNTAAGMNHKMFMSMHAKTMHTIVLAKNLTHFAHIHPHLNMQTGIFKINVNAIDHDPDNHDSENVTPYSGDYYVITEVMPMKKGEEPPMKIDRYTASVKGTTPQPQLKNDFLDARNGLIKYFDKNSKESSIGADYKIVFHYNQYDFCSWWLPKFIFEVYKKSINGNYVRAKDMQRWLKMGGHSILISVDNKELEEKTFYHFHAFLPISVDGEFTFPYHDHQNPLPAGNYKIWGQFKTQGKVFTFPFQFKYSVPDLMPFNDMKC